ncbi:MAG: YdcF family protein [Verrucomicrobiaceae bacterium]|nr:YdcF family protein [Verrucomicrobiaceae bacterium]
MTTDELAKILWDYMRLDHVLEPSDVILVLGSNDLRVAAHAADLYLRGLAPWLVFSGNVGRLTEGVFKKSEAEMFAEVAMAKGVPESAILQESRSTNTGANIDLSRELLAARGIDPQRLIVVQKPYMERRGYATFMKRWLGKDVRMSSPPLSFETYPTEELPKELIINVLVGDVQRVRVYPDLGFQIPQPMPDEVWAAWEELVARGYSHHLVSKS